MFSDHLRNCLDFQEVLWTSLKFSEHLKAPRIFLRLMELSWSSIISSKFPLKSLNYFELLCIYHTFSKLNSNTCYSLKFSIFSWCLWNFSDIPIIFQKKIFEFICSSSNFSGILWTSVTFEKLSNHFWCIINSFEVLWTSVNLSRLH